MSILEEGVTPWRPGLRAAEGGLAGVHPGNLKQLHAPAVQAEVDGWPDSGSKHVQGPAQSGSAWPADIQDRSFPHGKLVGKRHDHRVRTGIYRNSRSKEPDPLPRIQALPFEKRPQVVFAVVREVVAHAYAAARAKWHARALPERLRLGGLENLRYRRADIEKFGSSDLIDSDDNRMYSENAPQIPWVFFASKSSLLQNE